MSPENSAYSAGEQFFVPAWDSCSEVKDFLASSPQPTGEETETDSEIPLPQPGSVEPINNEQLGSIYRKAGLPIPEWLTSEPMEPKD